MKRTNPRLLAAGFALIAAGIFAALWLDNAALRYAGSISAVAIGLGLLRRAFRVE